MQGGNLSNDPTRRNLIVFEGLIGNLPLVRRPREAAARRMRRWKTAVNFWDLERQTLVVLLDAAYRYSAHFDVLTLGSEPFAEALAERLDAQGYPTGAVWPTTVEEINRFYANRPDISGIYLNPSIGVQYGSKLCTVSDPAAWRGIATGGS